MLARVWWWLAFCSACTQRACSDDALAVLIEHQGDVQRDHAASPLQFAAVHARDHFASGDGLRTGEHARARLELPARGALLVEAGTTIRLWGEERTGLRLKVQTGVAQVVAEHTLELQTELGVAVLQAGSELRVRPGADGQLYEVSMGRARLTSADGAQRELGPGERIGSLAAEPIMPLPLAAAVPSVEVVPESLAPAQLGDLPLRAGTSATIYDPTPPSRVQLAIPARCSAGAVLRFRGRSELAVTAEQSLVLEPGAHEYQLACSGDARSAAADTWRGTLRVVRNAGTRPLPRSAPTNTIDADGRDYTVLFQNIPPVLEVLWPDAPKAHGYTLHIQSGGAPLVHVELATPRHVFAAGALPEGRHELQFEAVGGKKSRKTALALHFDNASPMASLRAPPSVGFESTPSVHVAGVALPGAEVSVLGQRLSLDAQQRFAGDVTLPPGTRSLAVRIDHPRTGTRYYVRHRRSEP